MLRNCTYNITLPLSEEKKTHYLLVGPMFKTEGSHLSQAIKQITELFNELNSGFYYPKQ